MLQSDGDCVAIRFLKQEEDFEKIKLIIPDKSEKCLLQGILSQVPLLCSPYLKYIILVQ